MRLWTAMLVLCSAAWGQVGPVPAPMVECTRDRTAAACGVSKRDLKQARRAFSRGLTLQKSGELDQAFAALDDAVRLLPRDFEYLTAREVLRQQLVMRHLRAGNGLALQHHADEAQVEFRAALALDPNNEFARQRLHDTSAPKPAAQPAQLRSFADAGELQVIPQPGLRDFHLRGDTRSVYQGIAQVFGVRIVFDDSVASRQLRFDLERADFATAMRLAGLMSRTFWAPISPRDVLVIADTPQNRADFERMAMRTFYLGDISTAQELNDVSNVLRTVFEIRFVTPQPNSSSLVVRAPRTLLDAVTEFLRSFDMARPQVMLQFQVYQVNAAMARTFGLSLPLQWQAFNLTSAALQALQTPNVQNLINQLIASGGINQANTTAIAALLAQLQSQQNSLFKNPFGTFGGGLTRFAVPFAPATANLSLNESRAVSLEDLTLRVASGTPAIMRIGTRYPIMNATFSPIFNTPAISQVIQNNSFIAPFPSFTFEDLGINVKATPQAGAGGNITLVIDMEIKSLTGETFNGVPVISNRTYQGTITVPDGETGIIAGMLELSEQKGLVGLPGIANVPLLGTATSSHTKQTDESELLVLITPHLVRERTASTAAVILPR